MAGDVFLSGRDTERYFIQHLKSALCGAGIVTFWDDHDHDHDHDLRFGENISAPMERAIEESRISIIVITTLYCSSRLCLCQLLKILECKKRFGRLVIPIFLDVHPSQLRLGTKVAHADRVNLALQAISQSSGWDLNSVAHTWHESKFIQKIVEDVSHRLTQMCTSTVLHLIGLELRVEEFVSLLHIGSDRSCFSLEEPQANDNPIQELPGSDNPIEELPGSVCNLSNLIQGLNSASFDSKQKDTEHMGAQRSPAPPTLLSCPGMLATERSDHNKEAVEQDIPESSKMKDDILEKSGKVEPVELENLPEHLLRCTLYCCLFPDTYEFEKKTMVQLWVAEGFFEPEEGIRMEDLAGAHFDYLIEKKIVLPSRCVRWSVKYKITDTIFQLYSLPNLPQVDYLKVREAQLGSVSEQIRHLLLIPRFFDPTTCKILSRFKHLQTFVLHCQLSSRIGPLPRDFFASVKYLRSLVLNCCGIYEIASSIVYMKHLRYLDLSDNPIKYLPESLHYLSMLQTLNLDDCSSLDGLPLELNKLGSLRHLEFDILGQLNSMPVKMGNLTGLQTLRAFLVGTEDGRRIEELKNLNNLSGSFCISRLENVLSSDEAKKATMINKDIQKLELRWRGHLTGGSKVEEILDCLQPNACLQQLRIVCYNGSIFPNWMSNSYLCNIVEITMSMCINCLDLPSLGGLPLLKTLDIYGFNGVSVIGNQFHRICGNKEVHAFPKLEMLIVNSMSSLKEWSGVKSGDFPCLSQLGISCCPKLVDLQWISCLGSLKFLQIVSCDEIEILSLGNKPLPSLLERLCISHCPKLKEKYGKPNVGQWSQIAHVTSVMFDLEELAKKDEED